MALGGKAGGVEEVGVVHPQLPGPLVHPFHKCLGAARQVLRQGHGTVVGGGNADGLEHILHAHPLVLLQPDLAASHRAGAGGGGDHVVIAQGPGVDGLHDQQDGHDLGNAGGLQGLVLVDGIEHLPGGFFHQQAGPRLHRQALRPGRDRQNGQRRQGQQAGNDLFHTIFLPFS